MFKRPMGEHMRNDFFLLHGVLQTNRYGSSVWPGAAVCALELPF
jgi:hypothetical protein